MKEKWFKCGDFRAVSSSEKCIKFNVSWLFDIDKTDTDIINVLKSGNKNDVFSILESSKEDFDAKIEQWIDDAKINVVVLPPTKDGKANQVRWMAEYIQAANSSVIVLELESEDYILHSKNSYEERRKIMKKAYESWAPINEEIFLSLKNETSKEINFLFLDDIITAGLTGFAVAKKVHELTGKVIINKNMDETRWSSNFKFLCLAKINVKTKP